jgi:hypothetical protein
MYNIYTERKKQVTKIVKQPEIQVRIVHASNNHRLHLLKNIYGQSGIQHYQFCITSYSSKMLE